MSSVGGFVERLNVEENAVFSNNAFKRSVDFLLEEDHMNMKLKLANSVTASQVRSKGI